MHKYTAKLSLLLLIILEASIYDEGVLSEGVLSYLHDSQTQYQVPGLFQGPAVSSSGLSPTFKSLLISPFSTSLSITCTTPLVLPVLTFLAGFHFPFIQSTQNFKVKDLQTSTSLRYFRLRYSDVIIVRNELVLLDNKCISANLQQLE